MILINEINCILLPNRKDLFKKNVLLDGSKSNLTTYNGILVYNHYGQTIAFSGVVQVKPT